MLRQLSPDVFVAERPFMWNGIDVGGRSAVLRLSDGSLFVHSPVGLDDALRSALAALGTVKHVVAPNLEHLKYFPQWVAAYPEATGYAPPGMPASAPRHTVLARMPPAAWLGEVRSVLLDFERVPVLGKAFFQESLFCFQRPGNPATVLCTDFFWNYPNDVPLPTRAWKFGMDQVYAPFYSNLMIKDKARARDVAKQVAAWPIEALVPCHGRVMASEGRRALLGVFDKVAS